MSRLNGLCVVSDPAVHLHYDQLTLAGSMRAWPKIATTLLVVAAVLLAGWPAFGGEYSCGASIVAAFNLPPQLPIGAVRNPDGTVTVPEFGTRFSPTQGGWGAACQADARLHLYEGLVFLGAACIALLARRPLQRAMQSVHSEDERVERLRRPGLLALLFIDVGLTYGGVWYAMRSAHRVFACHLCPVFRPRYPVITYGPGPALRPILFGTAVATLAAFSVPIVAWRLWQTFNRTPHNDVPTPVAAP